MKMLENGQITFKQIANCLRRKKNINYSYDQIKLQDRTIEYLKINNVIYSF